MLLVLTLSGCATAFAPTRLVTPDELRFGFALPLLDGDFDAVRRTRMASGKVIPSRS
jgi:hypothetical protein